MAKIDLHIHTNASDGELSAQELIHTAIAQGMEVIGITDHDSIDSLKTAIDHSRDKNLVVVPGIEISCDEEEIGYKEVHIVGLFIDPECQQLMEFTKNVKKKRIEQKKEIISKLQGLGFDITFEEVEKTVKGAFGRPHVAKILLHKYPEKFSSVSDVFDKYLRIGKPAYVDRKDKVRMNEAIRLIKQAKGIAVLGHPGVYRKEDAIELIDQFVNAGGKCIETKYPYDKIVPSEYDLQKSKNIICLFEKIAQERGLLESGGSDFHGSTRPTNIGEKGISIEKFEKLKNLQNYS